MDGVEMSKLMDGIFSDVDSGDDPRFEYDVGDHVQLAHDGWPGKKGDKFQIVARRNGYPPPHFNCWFPLYYIQRLDGERGGGEAGPSWIEPLNVATT